MTMNDGPDNPASRADEEEPPSAGNYEVLDSTLDQLDSLLDHIEQKNDDLFAKLQDLLESNKETRVEMQSLTSESGDQDTSDTTDKDSRDDTDGHKPAGQ
ncbi:hypothetical protein NP493_1813g00020 [Ridgeia piscesae]|uniref:Uncharacterized protein n=1 Tax=Ridgeia piscesae TaxID=27915 RepID=A0AAD9N7V7_RIDPI|nr:hypothetical protein NP493_1813g00020 [Ridgeia piscesae]